MSDPLAARTDHTRSGPDAHRSERQPRPGIRVVVAVIARTMLLSAGFVTAYYLLPLDEQSTVGASVLLVCGLLAVGLVFLWETRIILRSPYPRLRGVEALVVTLVLLVSR